MGSPNPADFESVRDLETEFRIAGARLAIALALEEGDRDLAREAAAAMAARHRERSPEKVAALDRAKGLE